jgi:hypothetical protein
VFVSPRRHFVSIVPLSNKGKKKKGKEENSDLLAGDAVQDSQDQVVLLDGIQRIIRTQAPDKVRDQVRIPGREVNRGQEFEGVGELGGDGGRRGGQVEEEVGQGLVQNLARGIGDQCPGRRRRSNLVILIKEEKAQ